MKLNSEEKVKSTTRVIAYRLLKKIQDNDAYANIILDDYVNNHDISVQDKKFLTELFYGTIRYQRQLDWVMYQNKTTHISSRAQDVKILVRLGLYQLLHMDSVPDYAAISETLITAEMAGLSSYKKYINGLLANVSKHKNEIFKNLEDADRDIKKAAILHSHPDWIAEAYMNRLGYSDTIKLMVHNNHPPKTVIRVNQLKISPNEFVKLLENKQITYEINCYLPEAITITGPISVTDIPGYGDGLFYVQDTASQIVGYAVSPTLGSKVLDMCAAPGGKTFSMAINMKNQGLLLAADINPNRIKLIQESALRLGLSCIKTIEHNGTQVLSGYENDKFDYVLVDAPCTGTGVLRRKVDSRWKKSLHDLSELTRLQNQILDSASQMVKTGGVLIYSTCSLTTAENENRVKKFLFKHRNFRVESLLDILPESCKSMVTDSGFFLSLPHRHHMDGLFACRLIKWTE